MKTIQSINPANSEVIGSVEMSTEQEIKDKVMKAKAAQKAWLNLGLKGRIDCLKKLLEVLEENKDEIIDRTSSEMGMPISLSGDLTVEGISHFKWNLDNAERCLKPKVLYEDDNEITELFFEPFGVLACIGAWNFSLPNLVVGVSQALLVGSTTIMKYSEEIILLSKYIEEICNKAGLPEGVLQFVHGDGTVGDMLTDQDIDMISFTGSSETGQYLYKKAAEKFIPIIMELGGSSPGIVFDDVNVGEVIEPIFWQRFSNSSQFCENLKRLIVHESIIDEVVEKLVKFTKEKTIGDPMNPNTEIGPLVAERQVVKLENQLQDSIDKGAKVMCGGKRPETKDNKGAFFEPTILTNINKDMLVWKEEVFGPILPVVSFKTYEDAISLANDTKYGLSGFIYTNDQSIISKASKDIMAGSISTDGAHYYRPQNPFGGYKASGIGRENGELGFHEISQKKVIARKK